MSSIVRFWNGELLTGAPVDRDLTWKKITSTCLLDIRTDAAAAGDISLVLTCRVVPDHNAVGALAAPVYTRTIVLAEMNNVVQVTPTWPMKFMRVTAYSPTAAVVNFYIATFDLYASDTLGA